MADDLEAFLRQAAQRRAQRRPSTPPTTLSQPATPSRTAPPARMEPEVVVEAVMVPESGARLATHVDTSAFARRAAHLGEEIAASDEQLEARLHQTFDEHFGHAGQESDLGSLGGLDAPLQAATSPASLAGEIAALLANPNSLRNAIVLAEILAPPRERWG